MTRFAPILVTAFNRPENLDEVLSSLVEFDTRIYVALDAAKIDDELNSAKVEDCKKIISKYALILTATKIADFNQGCYVGVTSAIEWAFQFEEKLVILEDDILIDLNFMSFATEMLKRFESDFHIGGISAMNMVPKEYQANPQDAFRLSIFTSSWGWATWRNRWVDFEHQMDPFKTELWKWPAKHWTFWNKRYWRNIFIGVNKVNSDSWAYRWQYTNWINQRLTLVPNKNFSLNIGFGLDSTHTKDSMPPWWLPKSIYQYDASRDTSVLFEPDSIADHWMEKHHYRTMWHVQFKNSLRKKFPRAFKRLKKFHSCLGLASDKFSLEKLL